MSSKVTVNPFDGNLILHPVYALGELSDVNISSPTSGQVLTYNATSGQWENADPSGGTATVSWSRYFLLMGG